MDQKFAKFYASTLKEVSFSEFPPEMVPILEMIAGISYCNKHILSGLTKPINSHQDKLLMIEKAKIMTAVLYDNSESVNAVDEQLDTCLHIAVRRSDCDPYVVIGLLKYGADPNKANRRGDTALHVNARACSSSQIMHILLMQGGNVNLQNKFGDTPLHIASRRSHRSAKVLLDHGANAETINFSLRNAMHTALEGKNCDLSFIVKCLDKYPQLVNSCDVRNITPMHLAVLDCDNKVDVIRELLERGADVNAKDIARRTPLHYIQYNTDPQNYNIIKAFLKKGANIDARDVIHRTPLFYAVRTHNHFVVKELIVQGADTNIFDLMYKSVLNEAVNGYELGEKVKALQAEHPELLKQEMIKTFHSTQLFSPLVSSVFRHTTHVQILHMKSANGKIVIDNEKQLEIVKLLLEHGADPDFGNLEYRLSAFSPNLPCADKLITQYRVLRNFEKVLTGNLDSSENLDETVQTMTTFDIEVFSSEFREEWLGFRDECIFEVNKMMLHKIYKDMSLYDFVARRCSRVKGFEVSKFSLVDKFVEILNKNEYPCCKDILYHSIKREDLMNRLRDVKIFAYTDENTQNRRLIVLSVDAFFDIAKYLTKDDLINIVLSCNSKSKSTHPCVLGNRQIVKRKVEDESNENVENKLKRDF